MRPLEGVLSSPMIIHVYMEVKTPEETTAMIGSGSVHRHRETLALSCRVNDPSGKHNLRHFGDALSVVKPCVEPIWKLQGGGFSMRARPILLTEPLAQSILAQCLTIDATGISGLHFPLLALDFPDCFNSFQNYKGVFGALDLMCPFCISPQAASTFWCSHHLLEYFGSVFHFGVHLAPCHLSPPSPSSPCPVPHHGVIHILQTSPFPSSLLQDSQISISQNQRMAIAWISFFHCQWIEN